MKLICKITIIFLLLIFTNSAYAVKTKNDSKIVSNSKKVALKKYTNKENSFQFSCPKAWKIREEITLKNTYIKLKDEKDNLIMTLSCLHDAPLLYNSYRITLYKYLLSKVSSSKNLSRTTDIIINGISYDKFVILSGTQKCVIYSADLNNKKILIQSGFMDSNKIKEFQKVLLTLKFNKDYFYKPFDFISDTKGNYSFEFPSNWGVDGIGDKAVIGNGYGIKAPDISEDELNDIIFVGTEKLQNKNMKLEDLQEHNIKWLSETKWENIEIISSKNTKLSGEEALEISFNLEDPDSNKFRGTMVFAQKEDTQYTIFYLSRDENFEKYMKEFKIIVTTFKLQNK